MDVSVNNYSDGRTAAHDIQGSIYHCKGFTPWGSDSDPVGHHIDADGLLLPWLIADDGRAHDVASLWFAAIGRRDVRLLGWGREANPVLGEVLSYHQATWDPQALVYIRLLADQIFDNLWDANLGKYTFAARRSGSFEPASHTLWHRQWCDRLFRLTRDDRALALIRDFIAEGMGGGCALAFAWHYALTTAGAHDSDYVRSYLSALVDREALVYEKAADPYDGYSDAVGNYNRYWFEDMSLLPRRPPPVRADGCGVAKPVDLSRLA